MADNNQIITRRMKDKGIDAFVDVYDGIYGDLANGTRDTIFGRIYESQPTLMWGKEVVDLITFRNRMLLKFGTLHRGGPTLTLPVDNEHEVLTYNGWIENNDNQRFSHVLVLKMNRTEDKDSLNYRIISEAFELYQFR